MTIRFVVVILCVVVVDNLLVVVDDFGKLSVALVVTLGRNLLDVCGLPVALCFSSLSLACIELHGVRLQDFLSLFPPLHF